MWVNFLTLWAEWNHLGQQLNNQILWNVKAENRIFPLFLSFLLRISVKSEAKRLCSIFFGQTIQIQLDLFQCFWQTKTRVTKLVKIDENVERKRQRMAKEVAPTRSLASSIILQYWSADAFGGILGMQINGKMDSRRLLTKPLTMARQRMEVKKSSGWWPIPMLPSFAVATDCSNIFLLPCGQSYNGSTIINYDSRGVPAD